MVPGVTLDEAGIIYGKVGTTEFEISVTSPVEKTDYVQVKHETCGWILGQVDSIERRTNLSIEKATRISHGEEVDFDEMVSAKIVVLGYRDDRGLLQVPRTPFKAGQGVYRAKNSLIRKVVGLKENPKTGAYVGLLHNHSIPIFLDINTMVQKHVSILAMTGGGKSYMSGAVIEELMKHHVTTVIIDPHGEYNAMRSVGKKFDGSLPFNVEPRGYKDHILEFSPNTKINKQAKPLQFTLSNLGARELLALTNIKNTRTYLGPLQKALDMLQSAKPNYSMRDIINVLEADEDVNMGALVGELTYIQQAGIFTAQGTHITELVQEGKCTIINLKGAAPDIQELIVDRIGTALFELRKINKIPPLMLVAEEAHNYCPQQGKVSCSQIFRTIASEGRKFGLGLMVISQRAAKIDKNVLSQCNTQVILKVINPNDLKAIANSVEGLTQGIADEIQRLPVGVAIISGGGLSMPLFLDVRPRESKHGGESINVVPE